MLDRFFSELSEVSIPFIAGQWSLLMKGGTNNVPTTPSLNPLHCGAVVASIGRSERKSRLDESQSPSLRGSGRFFLFSLFSITISPTSQSPSLRGSGRFSWGEAEPCLGGPGRLNPLHCGAVVASRREARREARRGPVSIPFIAGQWSLPPETSASWLYFVEVSIPFIAGQWSLPA